MRFSTKPNKYTLDKEVSTKHQLVAAIIVGCSGSGCLEFYSKTEEPETPNWSSKAEKQFKPEEPKAMFSKQALLTQQSFHKIATDHARWGLTNKNADPARKASLQSKAAGFRCFETLHPLDSHHRVPREGSSLMKTFFTSKRHSQRMSAKESLPWGAPVGHSKVNPQESPKVAEKVSHTVPALGC